MNVKQLHQSAVIHFIKQALSMHLSDNLVFCTLRFNQQQKSIEEAKQKTRKIYSRILTHFQGRNWFKHPLPSITIIEHGKTNILHVHSVFNLMQQTTSDFNTAIEKTLLHCPYLYLTYDTYSESFQKNNNYTPVYNHLLTRTVFNYDVFNYIVKEYPLHKRHIDFENMYTSSMLFNAV